MSPVSARRGEAMAARSLGCLALVASALGALVGAPGCVDDGVSLHVICPIYPTIEDDACLFEADGEICVAEGVLNLAVSTHYTMELRVESGLKPRERDIPPQGEPNGIQVRSAVVELRDVSGAAIRFPRVALNEELMTPEIPQQPNPFTVVASGYVDPEGLSAIAITVIPDQLGERLRTIVGESQIVASITMKGTTNGAQEIEAGEYLWPIRLINRPLEVECQDVDDYCVSMLGQDGFAQVCPD